MPAHKPNTQTGRPCANASRVCTQTNAFVLQASVHRHAQLAQHAHPCGRKPEPSLILTDMIAYRMHVSIAVLFYALSIPRKSTRSSSLTRS
eukprot:2907890-Pleurochrysis_carterae.AAC.4